jgi:hypothetical protein
MNKSFLAALVASVAAATETQVSLGKFSVKNAAFPIVDQFEGSEEFLIVSSFGALSSGKIYVVPSITEAV